LIEKRNAYYSNYAFNYIEVYFEAAEIMIWDLEYDIEKKP
jgi:hypothetical protein